MTLLESAKHFAISVGLYKIARALHQILYRTESEHARAHQSLLGHFVKAGDLAFDVGANIGIRTEILLSLGATVVAFEPQPLCAREVAARRGNERLTVIGKAVGASEGTAQFYLKVGNTYASMMENWPGGNAGTTMVPVTTLDKAIQQFGIPAFCKIDVEGFEVEVLRGLSHQIPAMSFEYHCDEHGIERARKCLDLVAALGNYRVNLTGEEDAILLSDDWLTVPEFLESFPGCTKGNARGDMFVRAFG